MKLEITLEDPKYCQRAKGKTFQIKFSCPLLQDDEDGYPSHCIIGDAMWGDENAMDVIRPQKCIERYGL